MSGEVEDGPDRRWRRQVGMILLLGVAARVIFLLETHDMGFWNQTLGDAQIYREHAERIVHGDWMGPPDFIHAPLYPFVMALPRALGLDHLGWVRAIQIGFGAASIALLMVLTRRAFGARVARWAGVGYALLPTAIYFDGTIEKSSLAVLLTLGILLVMVPPDPLPSARRRAVAWGIAGVLLGALVLTRQNALALTPLVVIAAGIEGRRWRGVGLAAGSLLGFVLAVSPWVIRHQCVLGETFISSPNVGQNFWMGNNPEATGTYLGLKVGKANPQFEHLEWIRRAEEARGRTLTPSEVSDYFMERSLDFIHHEPGHWLSISAKKVLMTIGSVELPDTEDFYLYREHSLLLRILDMVLHFGILVPLAGVGIVMTSPTWRRTWPLHATAALTIVSVAAFVVFGRYRFPLAPIAVAFAAAGASAWCTRESWRRQPRGRTITAIVTFVALFLLCNFAAPGARAPRNFSYSNHGDALVKADRIDEALSEYRRAIELDPTDPVSRCSMGAALARQHRYREALEHYDAAVRARADFADARAGLGRTLYFLGRTDAAEDALRKALELDPSQIDALSCLGLILGQSGRLEEAESLLRRALTTGRADASIRVNLAGVLWASGRADEAMRQLDEVLGSDPNHVDALLSRAAIDIGLGRRSDAEHTLRRVLEVDPTNERARQGLDHLRAGRS
ncbi:MAG: tetratricopeptide repeat protein [Planctomycetes bacterium]|nr:tetratricopeptide repeat protein [Planctomycetota bacterium]